MLFFLLNSYANGSVRMASSRRKSTNMNEKLSRKRSKSRKGQRNLASSAGGVVIDQQGHVALRKVLGSYGGYGWTWAKGRVDSG